MKRVVRYFINIFRRISSWAGTDEQKGPQIAKAEAPLRQEELEIQSIWGYLSFNDNTQAFHLNGIIGFEEWITMEEIRRRIEEVYKTRYLNDRSLYPYIKTLADCGLFETSNVGGRRKWRKRELLIKVKAKQKETAAEQEQQKAVA